METKAEGEKIRQKRADRQKRRARGQEAKREVSQFAQRNFPSEKDKEATLNGVLVDLGDKSDSRATLQFDKNGEAQNAEKAGAENEGRRRDKVQGLERSRGRQMLELSLKRKRPEISTKLDEQPRVFSKSARVGMSTRATITIPDQTYLPMVREICSSLLVKTSDEPIGSGTFGTVYLAEYRGMKTAVKEITCSLLFYHYVKSRTYCFLCLGTVFTPIDATLSQDGSQGFSFGMTSCLIV